jgi:hypothetical protein
MSIYVLNPGGDVEVLVPGAALDLFFDNLAYAHVLIRHLL